MPLEGAAEDDDGADDELEDCVVGEGAGVDELAALEPQAASPRAAKARRPAAKRRTDVGMMRVTVAP
jgi:hypothetical protein